jgi:hypothetical protein
MVIFLNSTRINFKKFMGKKVSPEMGIHSARDTVKEINKPFGLQ